MHYRKVEVEKMVSNDKRIRIITGHYGSGKTEFAVNYVTALREQTEGKVAIADLDIVNVYFRSREKKEELEEKGIMVIASNIEGAGADVPAVSGAMTMPVTNKEFQYVVDLGGQRCWHPGSGQNETPSASGGNRLFYGSQYISSQYLYTGRCDRTDGKSGVCFGIESDWLHQ